MATHERSHLQACGIAVGNLRDCSWKPAGLHMETCGIAYGSQLDCFCQLDCIRDVQKMIAPSLIDEAMYRGGRKSFLAISKVLLGHFELVRVHTRLYEVLFLSANIEENIVLFCVLKKNIYLCLKFHTFYKAMRLADRCG